MSPDPATRLVRALLSLQGLSVGDAFGECFFTIPDRERESLIESKQTPPGHWLYTDDTMMAISIVEILRRHNAIREAELASHFAELYDPTRGYGGAMHRLLTTIARDGGHLWKQEATALFEGRGSYGNGAAMRVAPLGAYFADDLDQAARQARRSAQTTHSHPEAAAGAIAVAIAAALACRPASNSESLLEAILPHVPASQVREGIEHAVNLPPETSSRRAGALLGTGGHVSTIDTVPFTLWIAARHLESYSEALFETVTPGGDMDTTCAIVGGIVCLRTGLSAIPEDWLHRREPLPKLLTSSALRESHKPPQT